MYAATPPASRSSRSCTGSPSGSTVTAMRVGARSSLRPEPGSTASAARFRRSSACGPSTRNRQGFVRWWLGAQRASSKSSSRMARSSGSGRYALCVRRVRMACSRSMSSFSRVEPRMGRLPRPARILAVIAAALAFPASAAAATVDVYPTGGTNTAGPRTQISFRGATKLKSLSVTGSHTRRHGGRLVVHPDGRGVSFFPDHSFSYGELVTVHSSTPLTRADKAGSVRFRILTRPVSGVSGVVSSDPEGSPSEAQFFHSRKDLRPPDLGITTRLPGASSDDIFLAVKSGPGQNGPTIRDASGRLVWFKHIGMPESPYDFRAQTYRGRPVLTWWQGKVTTGKGRGHGVILDSRYRLVKSVNAGNGFAMDQHEFLLTPQGTALITAYEPVR